MREVYTGTLVLRTMADDKVWSKDVRSTSYNVLDSPVILQDLTQTRVVGSMAICIATRARKEELDTPYVLLRLLPPGLSSGSESMDRRFDPVTVEFEGTADLGGT